MKKIYKVLMIFMVFLIAIGCFSFNLKVNASTYDESGLVVSGSHYVIDVDEIENKERKTNVTFTFKTTDINYKGFIGGTFVVKYDADRMDIDPTTIKQQGRTSGVNTDYTAFQVNGVQGQRGMILVEFSSAIPGQDFDLTMSCINLFKDGNKDPLKIDIINRVEDPLIVMDINDITYAPKTPIIQKATISLASMKIDIQGSEEVNAGEVSIYSASVKNAISNNKVDWSITGATSSLTTIDANGNLFVADNETSSTIQIIATSQEDTKISAKKQVKVKLKNLPSIDIEGTEKVIKGTKNNNYKANVKNLTDSSVTWSLSGQTSSQTTINQQGQLTVGVDETASSLDVIATSNENQVVVAKKQVQLVDKTYTIQDIALTTNQINMNSTQTKKDLENEIHKNTIAKVTIKTNDGKTYTLEISILDYLLSSQNCIKNNLLNPGDYSVKYNLDLPYILIDENENISFKDVKTNIMGQSHVSIPIHITKKIINTEPVKPNIEKKDINNEKVITSDSTDVTTNIIFLISSLFMFAVFKPKKLERKKK